MHKIDKLISDNACRRCGWLPLFLFLCLNSFASNTNAKFYILENTAITGVEYIYIDGKPLIEVETNESVLNLRENRHIRLVTQSPVSLASSDVPFAFSAGGGFFAIVPTNDTQRKRKLLCVNLLNVLQKTNVKQNNHTFVMAAYRDAVDSVSVTCGFLTQYAQNAPPFYGDILVIVKKINDKTTSTNEVTPMLY